jgi:hypothetical protein
MHKKQAFYTYDAMHASIKTKLKQVKKFIKLINNESLSIKGK